VVFNRRHEPDDMTTSDGPTDGEPRTTDPRLEHPTVALLLAGDRFEDFFDRFDISFKTFRLEASGGWLFNHVEALKTQGVRTVLFFVSARVDRPLRFVHAPTGTVGWLLPSPRLHRKVRGAYYRLAPRSEILPAIASYLATPMRMLRRILRTEGCDAILCQEYEYARFDVCTVLGRLTGLPVFATYQGGQQAKTWLERSIRGFAIRNSAGLIIAASEEIVRVQRTYRIPSRKIANIPNGFDAQTWRPMDRRHAREEIGIPLNARVVGWHGRAQIWTKGLDVLLDAWDIVCDGRTDGNVLLLLVGSGHNTTELDDRVKSTPRVRWIDRYIHDRRELWAYVCAADVHTLPSRNEGFAMAPLEAMAAGLPVVATDAPGVADLLRGGEEDGGIMVPREDPVALAEALTRLLDDDDLARELGARARRRAERVYSLEVVGSSLRRFMFGDAPPAGGG
jgi:glycosyltransferase involved in cell wall biosynthesis